MAHVAKSRLLGWCRPHAPKTSPRGLRSPVARTAPVWPVRATTPREPQNCPQPTRARAETSPFWPPVGTPAGGLHKLCTLQDELGAVSTPDRSGRRKWLERIARSSARALPARCRVPWLKIDPCYTLLSENNGTLFLNRSKPR